MFPYDPKDQDSIIAYAKALLWKSLRLYVPPELAEKRGKGVLGNFLEQFYFKYSPNSRPEADFAEVGLELKTTPIRKNSKGMFISKERLVFGMIDYFEEYKVASFEESSFWKKNRQLLLMFYLHEKAQFPVDAIFKIIEKIDFADFPESDIKIIRDDWKLIVEKIRNWRAHELSEGDTMYLGACTKGPDSRKGNRSQPCSSREARSRAYSLKSKYLNFIIQEKLYWTKRHDDSESIVEKVSDYSEDETFESLVLKRFNPYIWMTEEDLLFTLGMKKTGAKNWAYLLVKRMLGIKSQKIEEFEKAEILIKTVTLDSRWTPEESMSFPQIQFKEIVSQDWEDSPWHETLTSRFLLVIFKRRVDGSVILEKVNFWGMPIKDLGIAKTVWEDTKTRIQLGDFNNFIKQSDDMVCHVRPKGKNADDMMETQDFGLQKRKCFWLNKGYIHSIIGET